MSAAASPSSGYEGRYVEVEGMRLHFTEHGTGEPVLFLHGWPTSSYLWRNVAPVVGRGNRAIALDLPGYGRSDKPLDASYSFRFYDRVLTGFLAEVGVERLGLAVHDIGGPLGLHWASQNPERVTRLALLNTLVFPKLSLAAVAFLVACRIPGLRSALPTRRGIRFTIRFGVHDRSRLTDDDIAAYQEPFRTRDARIALRKTAVGLHPDGLREIEDWLPRIEVPVRLLYGERDRVLPDVDKTMRKVAERVPQAELSTLPGAGHFCQEERPEEIGSELAAFFGPS